MSMSPVEELLLKLMRPPRILLVEADVDVAQRFAGWLKTKYDCVVVLAEDAAQALKNVSEIKFDLVFIDVGTAGGDVVAASKERSGAPVVALANLDEALQIFQAIGHGVIGLIEKPVTSQAVEETFRVYGIRARENTDAVCSQATGAFA